MEINEACELTGFVICEFEPDEDPCDECDKTGKQLYYCRTDYWTEEGEYFCADCVIAQAEDNERAAKEISDIVLNKMLD
jgi:hypothetical protein